MHLVTARKDQLRKADAEASDPMRLQKLKFSDAWSLSVSTTVKMTLCRQSFCDCCSILAAYAHCEVRLEKRGTPRPWDWDMNTKTYSVDVKLLARAPAKLC